MTIGYAYPNLVMAEGYNAPGGPYWALKTFLPIALSEEHPFWSAKEEPLPVLNAISVQKQACMHVLRSQDHVLAFTSGQYAAFEPANMAAKYGKFVYSTVFGFSVSKGNYGLSQGAYDSMLALSEEDAYYRIRHVCTSYKIEETFIYSEWMPWPDVKVSTWLIPGVPWHIRLHRIESARSLYTAEGGFSIPRHSNSVTLQESSIHIHKNSIIVETPLGSSGLLDYSGTSQVESIHTEANTNVLYPRTVLPTLTSLLKPGTHWLLSGVYGQQGLENSSWHSPPEVSLTTDCLTIEWSNKPPHIRREKLCINLSTTT